MAGNSEFFHIHCTTPGAFCEAFHNIFSVRFHHSFDSPSLFRYNGLDSKPENCRFLALTAEDAMQETIGDRAVRRRATRRGFVLAAVMLAMFMGAIEGTIVSTAMPSIVADLSGFSLFSWVFSSYLLIQTVTIPLYGKLADLIGRKPVFAFGVGVFLL